MKMIDLFPFAERHKEKHNNQYPLHLACRRNQSEVGVLKLIDLLPFAVTVNTTNPKVLS
jgi:hypothetical protein